MDDNNRKGYNMYLKGKTFSRDMKKKVFGEALISGELLICDFFQVKYQLKCFSSRYRASGPNMIYS